MVDILPNHESLGPVKMDRITQLSNTYKVYTSANVLDYYWIFFNLLLFQRALERSCVRADSCFSWEAGESLPLTKFGGGAVFREIKAKWVENAAKMTGLAEACCLLLRFFCNLTKFKIRKFLV